jgi:hypothetical protein
MAFMVILDYPRSKKVQLQTALHVFHGFILSGIEGCHLSLFRLEPDPVATIGSLQREVVTAFVAKVLRRSISKIAP